MLKAFTNAEKSPDTGSLRVNGVLIDDDAIAAETASHPDEADPGFAARRALVLRELLTQQARAKGLLDDGAAIDDATIDRLLDMECPMPEPTEAECRRYYSANASKFRSPDIVHARHILFALTEGVAMSRLRARAEEVRRDLARHPDKFDALARSLSNCPSGKVGGNLGQLTRGESVIEFDKALFDTRQTGLLPGLVRTRHGFHIVLIERRLDGAELPFEAVSQRIEQYLRDYVSHKAIQQYLTLLVSRAKVQGVSLDVPHGPLLQ
ncbi:peptidylprolyl isomerase [Allopusillimonas ginsengisoli]|uniref:peptidylprolyl isomerase n=1 Tax=Allopusillimonas ginsengisoli TaxID=453575 RepID=UPI00101F919A|nr:peptidylprolyl isomerase [Allopusillimonas ginsengisoli]TEA77989.1 peptidylprolyl isomerase [Allopusillimonas ginsengisoli]